MTVISGTVHFRQTSARLVHGPIPVSVSIPASVPVLVPVPVSASVPVPVPCSCHCHCRPPDPCLVFGPLYTVPATAVSSRLCLGLISSRRFLCPSSSCLCPSPIPPPPPLSLSHLSPAPVAVPGSCALSIHHVAAVPLPSVQLTVIGQCAEHVTDRCQTRDERAAPASSQCATSRRHPPPPSRHPLPPSRRRRLPSIERRLSGRARGACSAGGIFRDKVEKVMVRWQKVGLT